MENSNFAPLSDVVVDGPELEPGHEYLLHHQGGFFAGRHLLVDIWNGENLSNIDVIEAALRRGAEESGATVFLQQAETVRLAGVDGPLPVTRAAAGDIVLGRGDDRGTHVGRRISVPVEER